MWEWFKEGVRDSGNRFIADVGEGVGAIAKDTGVMLWNWFVGVLPDIVGLGTMVAGGFIIVGSMIGSNQMMRVMAYLSGGVIVSIVILMNAKGA